MQVRPLEKYQTIKYQNSKQQELFRYWDGLCHPPYLGSVNHV